MLRRGFWLTVGVGLGVWGVLKVQQAAARLTPSGALDSAVGHLRHLGLDAAAALDAGRRAKRATETELRKTVPIRVAIDVVAHPALPAPGADEVGRSRR